MPDNSTIVYILAGGLGTRIAHLLDGIPKPMAEVSGKPFLEWIILWLKKQNLNNIVILTGHKKETIINYFKDGSDFNLTIDYSIEEELLGTGGAVLKALQNKDPHNFIILNGDTFFNADLNWFIDFYEEQSSPERLYLGLKYKEDTSRYGYVKIDDDYKITGFYEKNKGSSDGYINGGIYIGHTDIFREYPVKKISMETGIFPELLSQGKLYGVPFGDRFIDIGIPDDFNYAQSNLENWFCSKKENALFLDRDGIIIEDSGYVSKKDSIVFYKDTLDLVKKANDRNMKIIIISNQAGIAKGYITKEDVETVNEYIVKHYKQNGLSVDDFYFCPFHEDAAIPEYKKKSLQRKPDPGMILMAAHDHNINLNNSMMIGDKDSDIIKLPYLDSYLVQRTYEIKEKKSMIELNSIDFSI